MKIISGSKASSRGISLVSNTSRIAGPSRVRRDRHVEYVVALRHSAAVRVQQVLEDADHQHALIARDDVFGAVAVVHVEVDDRRHARRPRTSSACRTAIAMLLKKQKPIASSRVAWWPGGRTAQNAFSTSPSITASVAATAAPAARNAAHSVPGPATVSGSTRARHAALLHLLEQVFQLGDIAARCARASCRAARRTARRAARARRRARWRAGGR